MFLVSSCSCICPIYWSYVLSWEWRCSWSSGDRRCSNYIWVINDLFAYKGASHIRDFIFMYFQVTGNHVTTVRYANLCFPEQGFLKTCVTTMLRSYRTFKQCFLGMILDVHIQSGSAPGQTPCGKIRIFFVLPHAVWHVRGLDMITIWYEGWEYIHATILGSPSYPWYKG